MAPDAGGRHSPSGQTAPAAGAPTVYVINSNRWLYDQLRGPAADSPAFRWAASADAADLILYPVPEWSQATGPEGFNAATIRSWWGRLFLYSTNDSPAPWAPGVFASIPRSYARRGGFRGGCYVPHHHRHPGGMGPHLEVVRDAGTELLWSFVGTVENDPVVRGGLMRLNDDRGFVKDTLAWTREIRWGWGSTKKAEGQEAFSSYVDVAARSKFVICPRGVGSSSMRLFEAMQMRRCPVIVSDEWLPPPFVDWNSCSVRIAERDIPRIPEILREREGEAAALGLQARATWERRFAPETTLPTIIEACLDIRANDRVDAIGRTRLATRSLGTVAFLRRVRYRLHP